jgi:putative membrane protein
MNTIVGWIVALLLGGLGVMIAAAILPGFRVRGGFASAMIVGLVYGVLKMLLQWLLILFTFPLVIVTLGLFVLVINAFLLWLTDKLMRRFEVHGWGNLFLGALILSAIDLAFQWLLRRGAPF